jgi:Uma2 family endonuclease
LVIEVLSPSTRNRDLGEKFDNYFRLGVKECWIVDPYYLTVDIFADKEKVRAYQLVLPNLTVEGTSEDEMVQSVIFDFSLRLIDVFRGIEYA